MAQHHTVTSDSDHIHDNDNADNNYKDDDHVYIHPDDAAAMPLLAKENAIQLATPLNLKRRIFKACLLFTLVATLVSLIICVLHLTLAWKPFHLYVTNTDVTEDQLRRAFSILADLYWGPEESPPPVPSNVTVSYDHRAFIINNERRLLMTGSIHYPRSSPGMWPYLFARAKAAGVNTIDTYVFWNLHETAPGVYDFEPEDANMLLFLKMAQEAGLYVALRIGPYICSEFNNGGIPPWLLQVEGIKIRQNEAQFMHHMETFVRKTVQVVEPFLVRNGGPIIMLQLENEYKSVMWNYFPEGHKFIEWAAHLAKSIDAGVPWFMCEQGEIRSIINSCNGYYCDNRVPDFKALHPTKPLMFTELWSGWFQLAWEPLPSRPAADVAFATARFVARGGTYVAYYMWHGGTNFGRYGGGPLMATSYDYDAPVNEYGYPHDPKHAVLAELHATLFEFEDVIVSTEEISVVPTDVPKTEIHVYWGTEEQNRTTGRAVAFLSNIDRESAIVTFAGLQWVVPGWSVSIVARDGLESAWRLAYSTVEKDTSLKQSVLRVKLIGSSPLKVGDFISDGEEDPSKVDPSNVDNARAPRLKTCMRHPGSDPATSEHQVYPMKMEHMKEPVQVGSNENTNNGLRQFKSPVAKEQIRSTNDTTDYFWYVRTGIHLPLVPATLEIGNGSHGLESTSNVRLEILNAGLYDSSYYWLDGNYLGTLNLADRVLESKVVASSKEEDEGDSAGHTLTVLSVSMGIPHWGIHMEDTKKGIFPETALQVNGVDVMHGNWTHVVGLVGEHLNWKDPKNGKGMRWETTSPVNHKKTASQGMTWHKFTFDLSDLCVPEYNKPLRRKSTDPLTSYALHIGGMGKGVAYVNGRHMGRYWTLPATNANVWDKGKYGTHPDRPEETREVCPSMGLPDCEYGVAYDERRCRHGCGEVVQPFMHVPFDWVGGSGDSGVEEGRNLVTVVLFEEVGGDPSSVFLARIVG